MSNAIILNVWFMSFIAVAYGVLRLRSRRELFVWLPATLLFGPFGAIIFGLDALTQWQKRHPRKLTTVNAYPSTPLKPTVIMSAGYYLYVQKGANSNALQGIQIPATGVLTLRRGAKGQRNGPNEFLLHDQAVSGTFHCSIELKNQQMLLKDASTNGTYVNGQHVHRSSQTISVGTQIRLGQTILVVKNAADIQSTVQS